MLQKLKVTSYAFIYFLLFGFSFIALQVTTEEALANHDNPDMVCNVDEFSIKQCGNPASINDACTGMGAARLYESVRMCYGFGSAYSCAVDWALVGDGGECSWGPPTAQWMEFQDMDERDHQTGAHDPLNQPTPPQYADCKREIDLEARDGRGEIFYDCSNRGSERGIMGDTMMPPIMAPPPIMGDTMNQDFNDKYFKDSEDEEGDENSGIMGDTMKHPSMEDTMKHPSMEDTMNQDRKDFEQGIKDLEDEESKSYQLYDPPPSL